VPITFCATGANSSNSVAELLKATITVSASTFLNTLRRVLVPFGWNTTHPSLKVAIKKLGDRTPEGARPADVRLLDLTVASYDSLG
jgi:hypothetical protein